MPEIAASARAVPHSRIRELAEMALGMDGVLKLYFGESNMPTPEFIKQAARQALDNGWTYYTSNAGMPSTREALARYYSRLHGVRVDPEKQIVATASGVQALNVAIRAVLDPGDEAIVLTPAWPNGSAIVGLANARVVQIPHVLDGSRFTIDFDAIERAVSPRTRLLLYTSPSNPHGWTANDDEQTRLLDLARRHDLWLMADEVYERLYYRDDAATARTILHKTEATDSVIVVQSFSKAWCMTGWRLGWLITRPDLTARITQLNEFIISHAASFTQKAAEVALDEGEETVCAMVSQYRANRDYCLERIASGMPRLSVPEPEGAFYLFPRVEGLADSFEFCKDLLMQTKVGLAPGVAFGAGGEGHIRICYASDRKVLEPAMDRLQQYLSR